MLPSAGVDLLRLFICTRTEFLQKAGLVIQRTTGHIYVKNRIKSIFNAKSLKALVTKRTILAF